MKKVNFLYAPDAKGDNAGGGVTSAPIGEKAKTDGAVETISTPIISGGGPTGSAGIPATDAAKAAMVLPSTETILCTVIGLSKVQPGRDGGSPFVVLSYVDKDGKEGRIAIGTQKLDGTDNPMFIDNKEMFIKDSKIRLKLATAIGGKTQFERNGYIFNHKTDHTSMTSVLAATKDETTLLSAKINQQILDIKLDSFEQRLAKYDANPEMREMMTRIMTAQ